MRQFTRCTSCRELFAEELEVVRIVEPETAEDPFWGGPMRATHVEFWAVCEDCKGRLGIREDR